MFIVYNIETNKEFKVYGVKKCLFKTKFLINIGGKWRWINSNNFSILKTIYFHNHNWHLISISKTNKNGIAKYTWKCFECDKRKDVDLPDGSHCYDFDSAVWHTINWLNADRKEKKMDASGNKTSVDTYDSDFTMEEIAEMTEQHFKEMKLMKQNNEIKVGDKVKVIKLISDGNGYASMPEHAVGNTYKVIDTQDESYRYGLQGVEEDATVFFREDELELV